MGWWKSFKAWLNEPEFPESPLKDWQPSTYLFDTYHRPTPAECSDEKSPVESTALVVAHGPISESVSDEKSADGAETGSSLPDDDGWFWAETDEEKAEKVPVTVFVTTLSPTDRLELAANTERLTHAGDLPGATFRVFPVAGNHRNSYDSEGSVRRAVAARKGWEYTTQVDDLWVPDATKVYRAETVWRDVTDEFVKP